MNSRDRKLRKQCQRRERIRREKHLRRFGMPGLADGDGEPEFLPDDPDPEEEPVLDLPPQIVTERSLRQVHRLMAERGSTDEKELRDYLETIMGDGLKRAVEERCWDEPQWQAQELAYQAMEAQTRQQAVALARRALKLDADCVDALVLLAQLTAGSKHELVARLRRAVEAGERSLGREFFEEQRGHFWGILQTRPYMRARYELASALMKVERFEEGISHLEALLELNPNDNQGVRDLLLSVYLTMGRLELAGRLLQQYESDWSALFKWGRVLERYLSNDLAGAVRALRQARRQNPYVSPYFTARKFPPLRPPDYYSPGKESEARYCALWLAPAWYGHPEAIAWLRTM